MTRTPAEEQLAEQLHRLAEHARTSPSENQLPIAGEMSSARRRAKPWLLAAAVALVLVIVAVVGVVALTNDDASDAPPASTAATNSARVSVRSESTFYGPGYVEEGEGAVDLAEGLFFTKGQRTRADGTVFESEQRIVGDCTYSRNADAISVLFDGAVPAGKEWLRSCTDSVRPIGFLPKSLGNARAQLTGDGEASAEDLGEEVVRGNAATHFRVTSPDNSPGFTPEERIGKVVTNDLWIDSSDRLVRLQYQSDLDRIVTRYEFYDFGAPVSVEPPPSDLVIDASAIPFDPPDPLPTPTPSSVQPEEPPTTESPVRNGKKTFTSSDITFKYPAAWNTRVPFKSAVPRGMPPDLAEALEGDGRIVSLSNKPQSPMCTGQGTGFSCGPTTVDQLRPSSFVLTWEWCPTQLGAGCSPATPGMATTIGGEPAQRWVFGDALDCGFTRGSEAEMIVGGQSPGPKARYYAVRVCLRGPNQEELERQIDAVLRTVRFR